MRTAIAPTIAAAQPSATSASPLPASRIQARVLGADAGRRQHPVDPSPASGGPARALIFDRVGDERRERLPRRRDALAADVPSTSTKYGAPGTA